MGAGLRATLVVMLALAVIAPPASAGPEPPPAPAPQGVGEDTRGGLVGEHSVLLPGVPPELLPDEVEATPAPRPDGFAAQAVGDFTPSTCFVPLPAGLVDGEDVHCGYVTAPLEHDAPEGATIALATAVIQATGPSPAEDPLLVLSGGPGEPILPLLTTLASPSAPYAALAARRDVVLVDQRGTGFSQPSLQCSEMARITDAAPEDQSAAAVAALTACHDRLVAEGNDLSAYTTLNNARDLDVVRSALGYDTWNVYGTSYGTFLALNYARLFAEAGAAAEPATGPIRTLTLSSAIPAEENFYLDVAPGFQAALERTFEACAADAGCRAVFDLGDDATAADLLAVLDRVVDRLQADPAQFGLLVPGSGDGDPAAATSVDVILPAETLAGVLFQSYYSLGLVPYVAPLLDALEEGDYEELFQLFPPTGVPPGGIALGMQLSVLCAEQVADTSPAAVSDAAAGTSELVRLFVDANPVVGLAVFDVCAGWDVDPTDPSVFDRVDTQVPTLVANGLFDHVTPPVYGRQVADTLPNAHLVEVPDAGHSPLLQLGACGVAIQNAFYADPGSAPDASCATGRTFEPATAVPTTLQLGSRVAGADRYATAAQAARRAFPDGADAAVLATGEDFPDALAAAGFAGAVDAPILLTGADVLPEVTAATLAALSPDVVHVAGGERAVSETVVATLSESYTVQRHAGTDRFGTAAALAEAIAGVPDASVGLVNGLPTVIVATGDSFADAMTSGPLSFAGTHPILLVDDAVPAGTAEALETLGIRQVVVLGGTAAVPRAVAAELEAIVGGPSVRLGGADRNATAAVVAETTRALFTADDTGQITVGGHDPASLDTTLLARNDAFPDALAGGPLGGRDLAPILLTSPAALPPATTATLEAQAGQVSLVRALGGTGAVGDEPLAAAVGALGGG